MLVAISLAAAPGLLALVRSCLKVYPDSPVHGPGLCGKADQRGGCAVPYRPSLTFLGATVWIERTAQRVGRMRGAT